MLHWDYVCGADGIPEDHCFAQLCVECSKKPTGWILHAGYKIKGNKFVEDENILNKT